MPSSALAEPVRFERVAPTKRSANSFERAFYPRKNIADPNGGQYPHDDKAPRGGEQPTERAG